MTSGARLRRLTAALLAALGACRSIIVERPSPQLTELPGCEPERRLAPIHPSDTVSGVPRTLGAPRDMIAAGRVVPGGFAGISYDTIAKVWAIQLVDTTGLAAARVAIVPLAPDTTIARALRSASARRVRWSIAELYDWMSYIGENIRGLHPGLGHAFVGIHYEFNLISFTVSEAVKRPLEARLVELGVPCGTVRIQTGGPARVLGS